jgi:UDP-N-acetylglucosamine--N-acetylmuramyl-(pentapeptide) pyrophosphoryl-undecaprenol N-acetylglucosamine transferase
MKAAGRGVLIMAGGTGGHIFPGLAVADELREHGINVRWLGARGGMECTRVADHGISLDEVRISGVRGKGAAGWLALPFRLLRAVWDARASMKRNRPGCAISFGGYAAGPGGIAAWMKGVPLIVHEQNRIPGMTNRFLARLADQVLQAFPLTFPAGSAALTCGNPVRGSVASLPTPDVRFFQRSGRPRLLVTGGSQGARKLNELVPLALGLLGEEARPRVFHQAGPRDAAPTLATYEKAGIQVEVTEFIEQISEAYAWADLVVCRAGALTVSELAAAGLGSVLVPFPHAVDDHQTHNARFLEEAGAARIVQESELTPESLAELLAPLLSSRPAMLGLAKAAHAVGVRDAAGQVVSACAPWIRTTAAVEGK